MKEENDLPWNFKFVSMRPDVTIRDVASHINKNWDWDILLGVHNLTKQQCEDYIDICPPLREAQWYLRYVSSDNKDTKKVMINEEPRFP